MSCSKRAAKDTSRFGSTSPKGSSGLKPISSSIRSAGFPSCGSTTAPRSPSLIGYFAAAVHPAYAHVGRPERYPDDPSDFPALRDKGLNAWGARRELPVGELKNHGAFKDRMLQRPAVRRALDDEQIEV
jgi:hypothetical protein